MTILSPLPKKLASPSSRVEWIISSCNAAFLMGLGWAGYTNLSGMIGAVAGMYFGGYWISQLIGGMGKLIMKPDVGAGGRDRLYFHPRRRLMENVAETLDVERNLKLHVNKSSRGLVAGIDAEGVQISSRLEEKMDDSQFAAFVGHELGHLRHGLGRTHVLAGQMMAARNLPLQGCTAAAAFLSVGAPLPAVAFAALAPLVVAPALCFAACRQQQKVELACDETGAAASGSSYQVIRMLRLVERENAKDYAALSPLQKLWYHVVCKPLPPFSTHPNFTQRRQHMHKVRRQYRAHQAQMDVYRGHEAAYQSQYRKYRDGLSNQN